MTLINEAHVAEPGLVIVEVAAADDATAFAFQEAIAARWATATADRTTREAADPAYGCAVTWTCASKSTHQSPPTCTAVMPRHRVDQPWMGKAAAWSGAWSSGLRTGAPH
ncbi:DUF6207 family protein [Streptomyces sporangiiformans]|uniref:DUF6207 family protein n=1 Tax=Streptomyces sporangiiformans TaxID=2315329 RepID=UPI001F09DC28|nr:DUF6207 family protein [Streptomyces sporangiiformans]